jgi:hypothetical protein
LRPASSRRGPFSFGKSECPICRCGSAYDPREAAAFHAAKSSIERFDRHLVIRGLMLDPLRRKGLYTRPTTDQDGKLWDVISEAPMSTEFAISRFLTPILAKQGWALFADCDVLVRSNLNELRKFFDHKKAVLCVKHIHRPPETQKMDGQPQVAYARKNWSSVMLFNCDHPSNKKLTVEMINTLPGRDLHRFCWLEDDEIGELPPEWNYLVGYTMLAGQIPKIAHFTEGGPWLPKYGNVEFADEWRAEMERSVGAA